MSDELGKQRDKKMFIKVPVLLDIVLFMTPGPYVDDNREV